MNSTPRSAKTAENSQDDGGQEAGQTHESQEQSEANRAKTSSAGQGLVITVFLYHGAGRLLQPTLALTPVYEKVGSEV